MWKAFRGLSGLFAERDDGGSTRFGIFLRGQWLEVEVSGFVWGFVLCNMEWIERSLRRRAEQKKESAVQEVLKM